MSQRIFNVFAFHGQPNETAKLVAAALCHEHGAMCATDSEGNPQAFFRLPVISKRRVLGVPRSEGLLPAGKPTLRLDAPK